MTDRGPWSPGDRCRLLHWRGRLRGFNAKLGLWLFEPEPDRFGDHPNLRWARPEDLSDRGLRPSK